MIEIFKFMHKTCAWTATLIVLFLIDLPLKGILCLLFLLFGLFVSILYPIVKKIKFPNWLYKVYDYATKSNITLGWRIWKMWN